MSDKKYNFNPTPEQLADYEFWASDAVPKGAIRFQPKNADKGTDAGYYIKKPSGKVVFVLERCCEANTLKCCPCGEVPRVILWEPTALYRIYKAAPKCCEAWHFNFEVNYGLDDAEIDKAAEISWNSLPRGFE